MVERTDPNPPVVFDTLADLATASDSLLLDLCAHELGHVQAGNGSSLFQQLLTEHRDELAEAFAAIVRKGAR